MRRWSRRIEQWVLSSLLTLGGAALGGCGGPAPGDTDESGGQTGESDSGGSPSDLGEGGQRASGGRSGHDGSGGRQGGSGGRGGGGRPGTGGSDGSSGGNDGAAGDRGSGGDDGSGGSQAAGGHVGSGGSNGSGGGPGADFVCPSSTPTDAGQGGFGGDDSSECGDDLEYDALADACVKPIACDEDAGPFGGGDGTAQAPFTICSAPQLRALEEAPNGKYYVLARSLDLSNEVHFLPIGRFGPPFAGTLCGAGRALVGLTMNYPTTNSVGLFSVLNEGAVVENLQLLDFDVTGAADVGALAGQSLAFVSNVTTSGSVAGDYDVGGLLGTNLYPGEVDSCQSSATVAAVPDDGNQVGGLVGYNASGTVIDSETTGHVLGHVFVGGLVGYSAAPITDSRSSALVEGSGAIGGLVGGNDNVIERGEASGAVWGDAYNVGGLVGSNEGLVMESHASGDVDGAGSVGGLVGSNGIWEIVWDSTASGDVTGDTIVGGLVGSASKGTVAHSGATGNVTALDADYGLAGGLVGWSQAEISESFASGAVVSGAVGGGLVGHFEDWFINKIELSYAAGSVHGGAFAGGLIGTLEYSVDPGGFGVNTSYAFGVVSGDGVKAGLIGAMPADYWVAACYYLDQPPNVGPGTPLTLEQFAEPASFSWGMPGTWVMSDELGRPILAWELD